MSSSHMYLPYVIQSALWLMTHAAVGVVALVAVRPRRELAGGLMAGAAGMWVLGLIAGQLGPTLIARTLASDRFMEVLGWYHVAVGLWNVGGWGLFVYGLVDLCRALPQRAPGSPPSAADHGPRS